MSTIQVSSSSIIVVTTTDKHDVAETIARHLVTQRLAACVQVEGPFTSIYRWHGQIEAATEWRCSIKTTAAVYAEVEEAIRQLHTYDEPEIIVLPITGGSTTYLRWLEQQVEPQSPEGRESAP